MLTGAGLLVDVGMGHVSNTFLAARMFGLKRRARWAVRSRHEMQSKHAVETKT